MNSFQFFKVFHLLHWAAE